MKERASRWMLFAMLAFGTAALSACGGAPPPETYVLGGDVPVGRTNQSRFDSPIVELRPVRIPDYLDTKDIVVVRRAGGHITVSPDARWGERLSVGVTRAVAASLAARLPGLTVMTTTARENPRWRVSIDIDAFGVQSAGECVLVGRWSVWTGGEEKKLRDEKFSMSQPIGKGSDAEIVAAMTSLVDQLAASMAPAFEGGVEPRRTAPR